MRWQCWAGASERLDKRYSTDTESVCLSVLRTDFWAAGSTIQAPQSNLYTPNGHLPPSRRLLPPELALTLNVTA